MGAQNSEPVVLTTRQKVAGAVQASGVSIPIGQIGTLIDAIVTALEPPVIVAPVAEASPEAPAAPAAPAAAEAVPSTTTDAPAETTTTEAIVPGVTAESLPE